MPMKRQTNQKIFPASRLRLRWACFPLLAIIWSLACNLPLALDAQSRPLDEYEVKAAFLFNFAKFVDWPKDASPNEHSPIRVGVVGKDPFGQALERVVARKSINGRDLQIVHTKSLAELKTCQIVFVSSSEEGRLPEIIMSLRGSSVLTVGESDDFAPRGGAIQFTIDDNKIRFTINVDAAERAHLKFSSKLLSLAKVIHDGAEQVKN
jgi:hypothetical protein